LKFLNGRLTIQKRDELCKGGILSVMQKLQDSLVKALSIDGALGVALGTGKQGCAWDIRAPTAPLFLKLTWSWQSPETQK